MEETIHPPTCMASRWTDRREEWDERGEESEA
jgi:hypothetical protein